jgi:signal transduction histidine kinase
MDSANTNWPASNKRNVDSAEKKAYVFENTLNAFLHGTGPFGASFVLLMVGIAISFSRDVPGYKLWGWCACYLIYSIGRTLYFRRFFNEPNKSMATMRRWGERIKVSAAINGSLWGMSAWFIYPSLPYESKLLMLLLLTAFLGAATTAAATFPDVVRIMFVIIIPQYVACMLIEGGTTMYTLALMLLVFTLISFVILRQHHEAIVDGYRKAYDNLYLSEDLLRRNQALEKLGQNRAYILASASHDLRQPVHALGMLVEDTMRFSSHASPTIQKNVETMRNLISRLSHSLVSLLDISRLETGAVKPNMTAFPLNQILDAIETEFASFAKQKGLTWRIEKSTDQIFSDEHLLYRVLSNLVANAVRYTSVGEIHIYTRKQGAMLLLRVSDTGKGVSAERLPTLFHPDHFGNSDDLKGEGLGLGLSIVARLCEMLGVTVTYIPKDLGSCFQLQIPLSTTADLPAETEEIDSASQVQDSRKLTILIVDNDELVLYSMKQLLMGWGYVVVTAQGADELKLLLNSGSIRVDFLVADYHLNEDVDGLEVISMVRKAHLSDVPAILLTGDISPHVEKIVRNLHHVRLLHKPLKPAILQKTITETI